MSTNLIIGTIVPLYKTSVTRKNMNFITRNFEEFQAGMQNNDIDNFKRLSCTY